MYKLGKFIGVATRMAVTGAKSILYSEVPHYSRGGLYTQAAVIFLSFAIWRCRAYYLAPGDAIAALGIVAALMTIRGAKGDYFTKVEQVIWVVIATAFFIGETTIIHRDRDQHELQQSAIYATQMAQFQATLRSFQDLHNQNNKEIQKTDTLLIQTNKNLLSITGGDSFGYAIPGTALGTPIVLILHNAGDEQLTNVHIRALYIPGPSCDIWGEITYCMERRIDLFPEPIDMGVVGPRNAMRIGPLFSTRMRSDGTAHYQLEIRAQNGTAAEDIWFRPSNAKSGTAYRMDVIRAVIGAPKKGDVKIKGIYYRELMKTDWTDIRPLPDTPAKDIESQ